MRPIPWEIVTLKHHGALYRVYTREGKLVYVCLTEDIICFEDEVEVEAIQHNYSVDIRPYPPVVP